MTVSIATARIDDELCSQIQYSNDLGCYVCIIEFENATSWNFDCFSTRWKFNNLVIKLEEIGGKKAHHNRHQIRLNFAEANIHGGDRVVVIFDNSGDIIAIGKQGEDVWLDVTDKFKMKSFAELNIDITSLRVY